MKSETVLVDIETDTTSFDQAMESLKSSTEDFGKTFASTISRSVQSGKSLEDIVRSIGKRFADLALKTAFKPVENLFGNLLGSISGNSISSLGGSNALTTSSGITPFAKGGVVSQPSAFNFGNRLGVMGEAGAEAIMPLARGADGRLGVAAQSGTGNPVNVVFNVTAADVSGFKKSEGQITTMLARAVSRGQRGL